MEEEPNILEELDGKTLELKLIDPDSKILKTVIPDMNLAALTNPELRKLEELFLEMTETFKGIGLSPVQVGIPLRMFIIRYKNMKKAFFNPKIIEESKETVVLSEGCLSYPYLYVNIKRSKEIVLSYVDSDRNYITEKFDGWEARIILHEHDHQEGRSFLDYVSPFKLKLAKKQQKKYIDSLKGKIESLKTVQ